MFGMIANAFGFKKKESKVLVVGLDNSGKSTMIQHLKAAKVSRDCCTNNLLYYRYLPFTTMPANMPPGDIMHITLSSCSHCLLYPAVVAPRGYAVGCR